MNFYAILALFGKVFLVEIIVEVLWQACYAIQHDAWAKKLLNTYNKNQYFNLFLNMVEGLSSLALLYMGYGLILTIIIVFVLTAALKVLSKNFAELR
jgi:hypothetical protein